MKLYLVRHGESIATGIDNERPLSEKGIIDIKHLAHFVAPLKLHVSYVYQSPKLRAKQTAEILSPSMSIANGIETRPELDALAPIDEIHEEIIALNKDMMLVGHMPYMGKFVSKLITGNENNDAVSFKAGSMVCLEQIRSNQWVICWMLNLELFLDG